MSYLLPHLTSGWAVDQAIVTEEDRVVVIRFGRDDDEENMAMDEVLLKIAPLVVNFAVIYVVDVSQVPDFNQLYELDPEEGFSLMFFFRNRHIQVDVGTGNNNKIDFVIPNKQEVIDIIETVFRGARMGKGLVVSPTDYNSAAAHMF